MHPEWLTKGWIVLLPKDPQKGLVPFSYRAITCLSTAWELLLHIISAKMNRHMAQKISWAQNGIGETSEEKTLAPGR